MTDNDRNMLMEIHTQTALTSKEVTRLSKVLEGNGKPGLLTDVAEVVHKQKTYQKQREEDRKTFRWKIGLSVTAITIFISIITTITMIFFKG